MYRRDFLSRIGLVGVTPALAATGVMYGNIRSNPPLFSHSWMNPPALHVYLDGVDVAKRCYAFFVSSGRGYVWLYRLNESGNIYYDKSIDGVPREVRHGNVKIVPESS